MPEPTTVWLVRLEPGGALRETKGLLSLSGSDVVFESQHGTESRFGLSTVRKVRRVRGSPVMTVTVDSGQPLKLAIYFSEPPPLPGAEAGRVRKRKARRATVGYLGRENLGRKTDVQGWVQEIREAASRVQGEGGEATR